MPKTHTNDVAAVLPAAVDGPFQVVDPADGSSFIKIDPALSRIEAVGDARPLRRVSIGYARTVGFALGGTIGTAIPSVGIGASADSGFFSKAMVIPFGMDLAESMTVRGLASPQAVSTGGVLVVRVELVITYGKAGDASMANQTITYDWSTPNNWSTTPEVIPITNAGGPAIAAGTFEDGDIVGFRLKRLGTAGADTYDQGIELATMLILEYTAKIL